MRYLLLLFLSVIFVMTFCVGCNQEHSNNETKNVNKTTETYSYRNGTIMIKDNTIYRDYGKSPDSFENVIKTEKNTVDINLKEIPFGEQ